MDIEDDIEPVKILLVEDYQADIRLIQEAFKDFKTKTQLYISRDGVEALEFLKKEGKYKDMPCPDLILLDLNLPRKNGRELLKDIKTDVRLKNIPVIILTTSNAKEDILSMHKLQANLFITKPIEFKEYKKVLRNIEDFWFDYTKPARK